MPTKIEHQQVARLSPIEQSIEFRIDMSLRRYGIFQIDDAIRRDAGMLEESHQLLVAAIDLGGGEGTPHVRVLPLEKPDREHPGLPRVPADGFVRVDRSERQAHNGDQTTGNPASDFHAFLFRNMSYVEEKLIQFWPGRTIFFGIAECSTAKRHIVKSPKDGLNRL